MSVIIRDKTTSTNQLAVGSDGSLLFNTDTTVSGNITALNANLSSGAATAGSTLQSAALNGASTSTIQVTGTWTGTLQPQVSVDNTNWWNLSNIQNNVTGIWTATIVSGATGIWTADVSGFQYFRLTMSASPTGTAAVVLRNSISPTNVNVDTVLTKGTQNPVGLSVQDLRDSGRNLVHYYTLIPVITTTGDVLQSLTGTKSGATVGATSTPAVVTTGKTFRVTRMNASYISTATSGWALVRLRFNTGGVVAIGSPIAATVAVGNDTPATANATGNVEAIFDEGLEFAAGTGVGLSVTGYAALTGTAAGYCQCSLTGYEY